MDHRIEIIENLARKLRLHYGLIVNEASYDVIEKLDIHEPFVRIKMGRYNVKGIDEKIIPMNKDSEFTWYDGKEYFHFLLKDKEGHYHVISIANSTPQRQNALNFAVQMPYWKGQYKIGYNKSGDVKDATKVR